MRFISWDGETVSSLGVSSSAWPPLVGILFALTQSECSVPVSIASPWQCTWEASASVFSLTQYLAVEDHDQAPLLPAHQPQVSLACLAQHVLQAPNHTTAPLRDSLQFLSVFSVLEDRELQKWPHKCCEEQNNHFPQPAGYFLVDAVQYTGSLCFYNDVLWTFSTNCLPGSPNLFLQDCCLAGHSPTYVTPQCKALHLSCWTSWGFMVWRKNNAGMQKVKYRMQSLLSPPSKSGWNSKQ